jgi:hypothetical protein
MMPNLSKENEPKRKSSEDICTEIKARNSLKGNKWLLALTA